VSSPMSNRSARPRSSEIQVPHVTGVGRDEFTSAFLG
jgi:hypothetical protein